MANQRVELVAAIILPTCASATHSAIAASDDGTLETCRRAVMTSVYEGTAEAPR